MAVVQEEREIAISVPVNKSEVVSSFRADDFAVPNGREEDWRFTPMKRIRALVNPLADSTGAAVNVSAPAGVTTEWVATSDARLGVALTPVDRVSALAWEHVGQALIVTVPKAVDVEDSVLIEVAGSGSSYSLIRVITEADSSATVVVDHTGTGEHATNVEVTVGDRSRLVLISVQDWDRSAVHLGRIHSQLGRDATLQQVVATFGGDTVRLASTVGYDAPGGSADLFGAYFADSGQHLEHRLFADHSATHCRSNVVYKGALQGEHAHTVWIGDVLIRASAVGTDTYEINRNLVLTDGARADSVPNLEIETGEITGAGHASTTGRFDDEQLFYLQSRGIAADTARRLVVKGFFAEVIDQIPTEAIRTRLWSAVEDEINLVGAEKTR
ncbi:MAG: Fe-S cluster assembly protein SufD [Actinobacteria bacterium]|nr:Fe-S cluster assembly protein SufD [Actinomycetota bacterium]